MASPADATPVVEAQKRADPELKNVVEFLRGKHGPKVRRGILNGKRVDYFKGKTAIRTLLSPQYQKLKKVPVLKDEEEAKALMIKLLPFAFFLRTDRPPAPVPPPSGTPKTLQLAPQQSFDETSYYTWFYDGSPLYTILGGAAMVVIMLAGVMFPLWPIKLRIGVWYLSIGVLILVGLFIVLAIVRLIFWCITVLTMKRAIWIYPNLFEDVGFFDSFRPGWAYDEPKKKIKKKKAVGGVTPSKKSKTPTAGGVEAIDALTHAAGADEPPAGSPGSPTEASATGVQINPASESNNQGGLRSRQAATIEEIEDDES
ncbi:translocation protein SEC62 [Kwoniella mangroviensis CBS 10435]|uniref:Translocation protein SEC62 n=1 Tax=Kwoniella mangroviensis CBS 10435 TaxID=1331196 RepID=A0A1B9IH84_9TREE|nr:translocation protein SEC62 [Kwoniella mangroviensis CBS 8507]OCF55049.1 translocation protein SEC62 [Kwoniella mangroviensis CBS 10435]OCF62479.1 translocation protein SEC62 [Kwoniella mangroviensis CBS 8507]OCF72229.1 translocation protein SEC62 [Kwoniella mangroviensis CBS 8886]